MSIIKAALGEIDLDLLIHDVSLVNVSTGEIYPADIGVWAGKIACVEPPATQPARRAAQVVDGRGQFAVPGLIDSHMHIESSLVTPANFAAAVLPHGTTTVAEDPHEIANVLGLDGVRMLWAASRGLPLKVCFLVPTCVPSAAGLETSGGEIGPAEVEEMLRWNGVLGLAEVMDSRAVVEEDDQMMGILDAGREAGVVIEGHNPMLRGRELNAYVAAGIGSDHTLMTPQLLLDKLRLGVAVQLQERYMTSDLISAFQTLPSDPDVLLVTDDVVPDYLEEKGHLDRVLRRAIELGMTPVEAVRSATIKPSRRLRLYDRGAIAPGKRADIVLVDSLEDFTVDTLIADGEVVVRDGELLWQPGPEEHLEEARGSVKLSPLEESDFQLEAPVQQGQVQMRVIVSDPEGTTTSEGRVTLEVRDGLVQLRGEPLDGLGTSPDEPLDETSDLARIAVFERHGRNHRRAYGLVQGLGLRDGAIASTQAHDSHNLVVIGREPADMARAANAVIAADGGLAAVRGRQVQALMELPFAGLLSPQPVPEVAAALRRFASAVQEMGISHPHLLMRLTTFTLPVSSGLRITDRGLVNAERRELADLWM